MTLLRSLWPYGVILIAYGLDRFSKLWAANFLSQHGPTELHPWLTIRETYNQGIAFGMLQGVGPVVGWLTIIVVIGLMIYLASLPADQWLLKLGLALLIGGATGNMWDRIVHGKVLDFLVSPIRPGIFNVADVLIYLGIGLCLVAALWPTPSTPEPILPADNLFE